MNALRIGRRKKRDLPTTRAVSHISRRKHWDSRSPRYETAFGPRLPATGAGGRSLSGDRMPSPRSGESRENFVGRCMSSAEAQSSFPHTDQRLAFCEATYDRHAHSGNQYVNLDVRTATCAARKQQFLGRQFRVVPAVLVRAQVLHNNLGTTYLPADEITDDWAALWNGIPVLVGPHPAMRGVASSGRTPEIWNERGVGWIFGAKADNDKDGVRRLTGEVWLDESRAGSVKGFDV